MKKVSMVIMLAALLAATIVGVLSAQTNQATEAVTRKVTVPAAFFVPNQDALGWHNGGMRVTVHSGAGTFTAPVLFPWGHFM